jgi:hypothetical protein
LILAAFGRNGVFKFIGLVGNFIILVIVFAIPYLVDKFF